jgi:deazaflavin-dependent oxidoreductase (nitroreductase family)
MTTARTAAHAPWLVRAPNRLVRWLLAKGAPMGPNVAMTVRGRASGEPRTFPVAVSEIDGRRYVIGAYGDVNWTRNLRAAGEATIRHGGRDVHVTAHELNPEQARAFYGAQLPSYIAQFPAIGRVFGRLLFGAVAPEILNDPAKAAATRPVFELRSLDSEPATPA